jgi:hypothetical protein
LEHHGEGEHHEELAPHVGEVPLFEMGHLLVLDLLLVVGSLFQLVELNLLPYNKRAN